MATHLIDIDGTIFKRGTNEPLPGALEMLKEMKKRGDQIIFTTLRGPNYARDSVLYDKSTIKALADHKIEYDHIIFELSSPRVVWNDDGAFAVRHNSNQPISIDELDKQGHRSLPPIV